MHYIVLVKMNFPEPIYIIISKICTTNYMCDTEYINIWKTKVIKTTKDEEDAINTLLEYHLNHLISNRIVNYLKSPYKYIKIYSLEELVEDGYYNFDFNYMDATTLKMYCKSSKLQQLLDEFIVLKTSILQEIDCVLGTSCK